MAKKWRCAVVGCGVIGELHARVIQDLPNATLVAVCDSVPQRAAAKLEKVGLPTVAVYEDVASLLRSEQIDVVHICTPSGIHLEPALAAIEAGVNVICEKPLEITLDRIDRMLEAAAKKNVRIGGIFQNRWDPANRAIYDAAQQNRFGRIAWAGSFTPWYRAPEYYRSSAWRGTWNIDGGGVAMVQAVHAIDLLQWIAGPVKQVSAYAGARGHEIEVEDTLSCSLQFASGAFGTIMGSTSMYPGASVRTEVGGENGTAVAENGLKMFKFRDERPGDAELMHRINSAAADTGGATSQFLASHKLHVANVASILSDWDANRDAELNGTEARKAIAIILAMYESARNNGQPVSVR